MSLISPLDGSTPLVFQLDPTLTIDDETLGYLEYMNMDISEVLPEENLHIENWSEYMWSTETGFEHLDTRFLPGTR